VNLIGVTKDGAKYPIIGLSEETAVFVDYFHYPDINTKKLDHFERIRPYRPDDAQYFMTESEHAITDETDSDNSITMSSHINKNLSKHMIDVIKCILTFSELEVNWDAQGALPIEQVCIQKAIRLLHIMNEKGILKDAGDKILESKGYVEYDNLTCSCTSVGGIQLVLFYSSCVTTEITVVIPPDEGEPLYYACNSYLYDTTGSRTHSLAAIPVPA
jgi:hypothetical protein